MNRGFGAVHSVLLSLFFHFSRRKMYFFAWGFQVGVFMEVILKNVFSALNNLKGETLMTNNRCVDKWIHVTII